MKVRLLARDSKMPNIAIMKCSTYWKQKGADVGWYDPMFDSEDTDIFYESQLFDFTEPHAYDPKNAYIFKGGTGIDIEKKLPKEIDAIDELDYSLYPNHNYSMQFYSRGCIRNCPFCVVRRKEGYIYPVKPMKLNPNGKHIEILDNNFFANPEWRDAYKEIMAIGQPVKLHGVDVRIIDEEQADALNRMPILGYIHIAWDNSKMDLRPQLENMLKYVKSYKIVCYVLIGFDSTIEEDLYRVETLRSYKIDPFIMPFVKDDPYQKRLARYVNKREIFRSCTWENYKG